MTEFPKPHVIRTDATADEPRLVLGGPTGLGTAAADLGRLPASPDRTSPPLRAPAKERPPRDAPGTGAERSIEASTPPAKPHPPMIYSDGTVVFEVHDYQTGHDFVAAMHCPLRSGRHPREPELQQEHRRWAREQDLFAEADYERFCAVRFDVLVSAQCHMLSLEAAVVVSHLMTWVFAFDDAQEDRHALGVAGIEANRRAARRHLDVLDGDRPRTADSRLVFAFVDMLDQVCALGDGRGDPWYARFAEHLRMYFTGSVGEGILAPSVRLNTALQWQVRWLTIGVLPGIDVAASAQRLPPAFVTRDWWVQRMDRLCVNYNIWVNELLGLDRDQRCGLGNTVLILRDEYRLSLEEATRRAAHHSDQELRALLEIERRLPELVGEAWPAAAAGMSAYGEILKGCMRGLLDWTATSARYRGGGKATLPDVPAGEHARDGRSDRFDGSVPPEQDATGRVDVAPRPRLGGPTGLGTGAVRLPHLPKLASRVPARTDRGSDKARALTPSAGRSLAGRRSHVGTVAVFGGGVAGLTAVHELVERGFDVTIYERRAWGGRARSTEVDGSAGPGRRPLPGEHGFRITAGYYQNLPDTMRRIPFGSNPNGVLDNLVALSEMRFAREGRRDLVLPLNAPEPGPQTPQKMLDMLAGALTVREVSSRDVARFVRRMVVFLSSCDARRDGQWEPMSWAEFIGLDEFSDACRRILGVASEVFAPESAEQTSARHAAWKFELASHCWPGHGASGPARRVLDLPTNDAWIDPWVEFLAREGAEPRLGCELVDLRLRDGAIVGARVATAGGTETVTADWYVCALPLWRARAVLSGPLHAVDDRLRRMGELRTGWFAGIQFYLGNSTDLCDGAGVCGDSPWVVGYMEYERLWSVDIASTFGDGRVRQVIATVVGNWRTPGVAYGKPARDCTPDELACETWEQLKSHVNKSWEHPKLTDDMLVSWSIDEGLTWRCGQLELEDPFTLPTAGTAQHRPGVTTAIPNLVLAGDYLDGEWEVGTMEAACFNGRRAANAILERAGSREQPAAAIPPFRPPEWEPLKAVDALRYAQGEPNLFDIDGTLPPDSRRLLDRLPRDMAPLARI
jgi:uncharacterized protein with NAD-binding domain and iron-sulfur cluster